VAIDTNLHREVAGRIAKIILDRRNVASREKDR
jgi:hypothetical protein